MRAILRVGFLALLVLAVALPTAAQPRTTLRIIWVGWPEEHVMGWMQAAQAETPGVTFEVERIPFGRLLETLDIRLGARAATPDIYAVDGPLTGSYAVRNHLLSLDDVFSGDDKSDMQKACIDQGTWGGRLFSAPLVTSSQLLYYNRDLFRQAGIPLPSTDPRERWTWERVVEAARKIARPSEGIWGLLLEQSARPYQVLALANSKGVEGISQDGLRASGFVNSARSIEAFTFYRALYNEWQVSPKGVFEIAQATELMGSGKLGMLVGELWNLRFFEAYRNLNYGVAPHPYFAGGRVATPTGSWHIGINPRTANRQAAVAFVRALVATKGVNTLFDLSRRTPCRRSVYRERAGTFSTAPWRIVLHELANTAVPRPKTPGFREYEDILYQALRDIQLGAEVKRTLDTAAARIDSELAKYR
jgi:ABC-type glycerol-3-phosphate transport system substrate-binding protein